MSGSNIIIQICEVNSVLSSSREKLKKLLANTDFKKVRDTVSNELEQAIKQENTIISSNTYLLESLQNQLSFLRD